MVELRVAHSGVSKRRAPLRTKTLTMALVAGLLATMMAYFWLQKITGNSSGAKQEPVTRVLVPVQDIPARTLVTPEMLQMRAIPNAQITPDAAHAMEEVVGKVTTTPLASGKPISKETVAVRGIDMGLAYTLPPSYRAISISLDPVGAVAGFVKPGDHVDVIGTFAGANGRVTTRLVLQNVVLLATGTRVLPGVGTQKSGESANGSQSDPIAVKPEEIPNATLMVTPVDAQELILAASRGKLQLALRGADDQSRLKLPASTVATHVDRVTAKQPQPAPKATVPEPSLRPAVVSGNERQTANTASVAKPITEIRLDGVMITKSDSSATLTSANNIYIKRVGDAVAHGRIVGLTAEGIILEIGHHVRELWAVGSQKAQ